MNNDLAAIFGGTPFTPATVEPATDFDVYPPGEYPVLIEAAEVKQTKAGTGHLLRLTMQILDGPHRGRKLFDNINLQNPSAQCTEIGMRTLSALGRAIGLQAITDTDQLLNQVVVAHVKVKDNQNNVRTYSASGQQAALQTASHVNPAPAPIQAATDPRGAGGSADALPRQSAFATGQTPPTPVMELSLLPVDGAAKPPRPWDKK